MRYLTHPFQPFQPFQSSRASRSWRSSSAARPDRRQSSRSRAARMTSSSWDPAAVEMSARCSQPTPSSTGAGSTASCLVANSRLKEGSQTTKRLSRGDDLGKFASQRRRRRGEVETRVALVSGGTRGVGLAVSRRLGPRDGAALLMRFLCADVCSLITGQVWPLNGTRAM